jgi:hypothetical protein
MTPGRDSGPTGSSCLRLLRRRLWKRLGLGTASILAAVVIAACSSAPSSHPSADTPSLSPPSLSPPLLSPPSLSPPSPGALATPPTGTAGGPLACVTAGRATAGDGPWKLITPLTLCQLPLETSPQYQQSGQALAGTTKILITMDNAGTVTSTIAVTYQASKKASEAASHDRSVSVVGFDGRFRPAAALSAVEEQPEYTYTNLPPGPHGGLMGCANIEGTENCVWATSTTVCEITIIDPTGELISASSGANAVRIRDVLEAPA